MKKIFKNKSWICLQQKRILRKKNKAKIRKKRMKTKNQITKVKNNQSLIYKTFDPPTNFSFLDSPNLINEYFNNYEKEAKEGFSLEFNLSKINHLSFDGIALLIAKIKNKQFRHKSNVRGINPPDNNMQKLFLDTGFFEHIGNINISNGKIGKMIHNITKKQVSSEEAGKVTNEISEHTGVEGLLKKRIYEILVECMSNTQEHAGIGYDRWLMYYHDNNNGHRITKICFIDLGVGILKSINTKVENQQPLTNRIRNIISYHTQSEDIFKALINGDTESLRENSKTGKLQRGQGLPTFKKISSEANINKFVVISNDVRADIKTDKYQTLDENFHGTFIYLEISNK